MPRLLALEWNDTEARLAVAGTRGDRVQIEHAFSVSLRGSESGGAPSEVDVGGRIAAALAARGLGRLDTLVAVGRTNIELRRLSLPPAPDEELPELVRFQAQREFNALEEDWPLDFITIGEAADQPRSVLAAALDSELVGEIERTCQGAGLKPRRLILRPCAAASLLCRARTAGGEQVTLLVDLLVEEADLTVISNRRVIFLRTARLPGDPLSDAATSRALLSEIRRTMAAAQNQLGGQAVGSIVLCGSGQQHAELVDLINEQLATPTELFDPFEGLHLSAELERVSPDHPGRFAPLLGALADEMEGVPHAIDFLHPRRPPQPPSRRNTYALAGLAGALVLALLLLGTTVYCNSLDRQVEELGSRAAALEKDVAAAEKIKAKAKDIDQWGSSDFCWLKELRWLSEKCPPAKEVMLTEMQMTSRQRFGGQQGQIEMTLLARDIEAIKQSEENLRDERHEVSAGEADQEESQSNYSWRASAAVLVGKEAK